MTDKISDKDKKDWENFLKSTDKLEIKDKEEIKRDKKPRTLWVRKKKAS